MAPVWPLHGACGATGGPGGRPGGPIGRRRAGGQANKKPETRAIPNAIMHKRCTYMLKCDGLYFRKTFQLSTKLKYSPRTGPTFWLPSSWIRATKSNWKQGASRQVKYKMFEHLRTFVCCGRPLPPNFNIGYVYRVPITRFDH